MAKQSDSDAHDAYCQLTGSYAVIERRLLGWGRGEGESVVAKHWRILKEMHGPVPVRLQNLGLQVKKPVT